jgi:hypothetical protein
MEEILYTMVAETVHYGMGRMEGGALSIGESEYPARVCAVLEKGKSGEGGKRISGKEVRILEAYFLGQLKRSGYVARLPVLGQVKSRKFRMDVRKSLGCLEPSIRSYIETGDRARLDAIDPGIKDLEFLFAEDDGFGSFYRDSQDMAGAYLDARSGNPRNYEEYYTRSGRRKRIGRR